MKQKSYFFISLWLVLLALFVYSCDEPYESANEEEFLQPVTNLTSNTKGLLVIKLTDAPFPVSLVKEANVAFKRIEIRKDSINGGFITLTEKPDTFNLISLRNGITAEIGKFEIPDGKYDQIRVIVEDAEIILKDGKKYDLKIPSGPQTGIKIFIDSPVVVKGGLSAELLLDFDLERSFEVQGNPDTPAGIKGFHFKPVIRVVNNSVAGRLTGTVRNDSLKVLADARVWIKKDTVVSSAFTGTTGVYALIGLQAGTYTAYATKSGYDTVSVPNVRIYAANQTQLNFTLKAKK